MIDIKQRTPENLPGTWLLAGLSGTGKTTTATSVIGSDLFEPVLVVDVDDGLSAAANKNPMSVRISSASEMEELIELMLASPDKQPLIEYKGEQIRLGDVKTIVLDSLTALRFDQMIEVAETDLRKQARKPDSQRTRFDVDTPQLQDYMVVTYRVQRWIRTFKQMGIHLIVTAGMKYDNGILSLDMNAKLAEALLYHFTYIWQTRKSDASGSEKFAITIFGGSPVKTRATDDFKAELLKLTDKGLYVIPGTGHPTLPVLYQLYLERNTNV